VFPYGKAHPKAAWHGEPARGSWRRRAPEVVVEGSRWRAGRIGPWCWEFTYKNGELTAICWRRTGKEIRGCAAYRFRDEWSFAGITKKSVLRWGADSPYTESCGRPGDAAWMVMRP
jgi:hypothetical protein